MPEPLRPTTVITAHISADYDAIAAMVAAGKLYPGATLVSPPLLERQGTHIFTESMAYIFNIRQPRECDFSGVTLLVVVDTHQIPRIEHVKEILTNPDLEIHVYDHHPGSDQDIRADKSVIKEWGATTSILTHIIKEQGIELTPDEATMLGLGIYEDTGAFTFQATTEHDFMAAAYLHGFGMDLETIAELTSSDLTREQIHILDALFKNAVTHPIQGIPITVTEIALDKFMGDFASLAQRLINMEHLKVLFVLAAMGDRVHMIARSSIPEVDVGEICKAFHGGGHSYAASASIKEMTLPEIRGALMALLISTITPPLPVGAHMTAPAISVEDSATITEAEDVMSRFGLKAVPVLKGGSKSCVGVLELQTATRAVAHKLGDLPVSEYMQRNVRTLTPESDLYQAMEIILKMRQRLVPVLEDHEVVGVLTRTDIIRLLIDDTLHIPEALPLDQGHLERNVASVLRDALPEELVALLEGAGRLGDSLGVSVYAVGGFVRDLLLKRSNLDIDLSVEGDGILYAQTLARKLGGRVRVHHKFKTAIVFYTDENGVEQHLDVATARLEYYEYPGALPTVEYASIKMDLYRRDFTINALAIQVNAARFGTLIDPFGAQRDIKDRSIAVLHSLSFVEDPTRILRAIRFERRYLFRITTQTERLIKNALSLQMLDRLSGPRIFNELKHIFDEKDVPSCMRRMENWNILYLIHPLLKLTPHKDILLDSIDEVMAWYRLLYKTPQPVTWMVYLLGLCSKAKTRHVSDLLDRLGFAERLKMEFQTLRGNVRKAGTRLAAKGAKGKIPLSVLYDILHQLSIEGLLFLMARHGHEHNIGRDVTLYLTQLKDTRIDISGEDLEQLGEAPGPDFGKVLRHVLYAKLDGKATSREDQLECASRFFTRLHEGDPVHVSKEVLKGRT